MVRGAGELGRGLRDAGAEHVGGDACGPLAAEVGKHRDVGVAVEEAVRRGGGCRGGAGAQETPVEEAGQGHAEVGDEVGGA